VADIEDRAVALIRRLCPWLQRLFADGGYSGDKLSDSFSALDRWTIDTIRRPVPATADTAIGLEVVPHRWVLWRTSALLGRCSRLGKNLQANIPSAVVSNIRLLAGRLARHRNDARLIE
jgi:transposase